MTRPRWEHDLELAFENRDRREKAFIGIIENYKRLALRAARLGERNNLLMINNALAKGGSVTRSSSSPLLHGDTEGTISSLRAELSDLYKTQTQNAQRLLSLNDEVKERQETAQANQEELKLLRMSHTNMIQKFDDQSTSLKGKDEQISSLQDNITQLLVDISNLEQVNMNLEKQNEDIVANWLEKIERDAKRLNEANKLHRVDRRKAA